MFGDEARGADFLLAQFGVLVDIASPCDQLVFDLRGALTDFLLEVGTGRLRAHGRRTCDQRNEGSAEHRGLQAAGHGELPCWREPATSAPPKETCPTSATQSPVTPMMPCDRHPASRGRSGGRVSAVIRNNVHTVGAGQTAMVFAHGFGCDQNMWRHVSPAFEDKFRIVLFDHVGAGGSDLKAYDPAKYSTLNGYADDVVEIGDELGLKDAVFVGHSVSAMIGLLASLKAPGMFKSLVMVGPSPRYIDDEGYAGGFKEAQITELLDFLADNYMGWSTAM